MFRSFFRWIRAIGYYVTGNFDEARRILNKNPHVIRATYEGVIEEKKRSINQMREAVSGLTVQEQKKKNRLKEITEQINFQQKLKTGSLAKGKELAEKLQSQGKSPEEIKTDSEYVKVLSAFQAANAKSLELQKEADKLEEDVKRLDESLSRHKVNLQNIQREINNLKSEQEETIADVISSQEEKELNDLINGISVKNTDRELTEMREMREKVRAEAQVSRELSGADLSNVENELVGYAEKAAASSEFDSLIGLSSKSSEVSQEPVKLPEA